MAVILKNDGGQYYVRPFDNRSPEVWTGRDVAKFIDEDEQAERRALAKSARQTPKLNLRTPEGGCPECHVQPPSYQAGVVCPNCGFLSEASFRQFIERFEASFLKMQPGKPICR